MPIKCIAAVALMLVPTIAVASETVTYSYDALGRLREANQSGANSHVERLAYDRAGNRTSLKTEGSVNGSATGVVVVPLGSGLVVIPVDRR